MRFAATAVALAAVSSGAVLPLSNGFPALTSGPLATVQKHAGGALPNGPLPTELSPAAIATFQIVTTQETFEVAFFTHVLHNLKMAKPGFVLEDQATTDAVYAALFRIRAQEELHAAAGAALLETAGAPVPKPCSFKFTPTSFEEAMALANTFTDVVLGVLPTVQALAAADGGQEEGLIPILGSILGQEAEQNGFYRLVGKKKPSAAPFITGGDGRFAYSALKSFIIPGTCPLIENLPVPSFPLITIENPPFFAIDTVLNMAVAGPVTPDMVVTYMNGASIPFSVPITNLVSSDTESTFSAALPFETNIMAKGLTLVAVTDAGEFASPADVADVTHYGPGLLEVR